MRKKHINPRGVRLKKKVLQRRRKDLGLSQSALARKADFSGFSAWRAENGYSVDLDTATAIAVVLGMDVADLIEKDAVA